MGAGEPSFKGPKRAEIESWEIGGGPQPLASLWLWGPMENSQHRVWSQWGYREGEGQGSLGEKEP